MEWFNRTSGRLQIAAVALFIVSLVYFIVISGDIVQELDSARWPSVEGEIIQPLVKTYVAEKSRETKYFGRVSYQYEVNGVEYTSDLTDLSAGTKHSTIKAAMADVAEFRPGMKVPVYHDPKDPQRAILRTGLTDISRTLLVALGLGALMGAIGSAFAVRSWRHGWVALRAQSAALPSRPAVPLPEVAGTIDYDESQADSIPELGKVLEVFRPSRANQIAGIILGSLCIVGGVAVAVWILSRSEPRALAVGDAIAKYVVAGALGLILPLVGVGLLIWMKRQWSFRLLLCEHGLGEVRDGHVDLCLWKNTTEIREVLTPEAIKVLKVPGGTIKRTDRTIVVCRSDDRGFIYGVNSIGELELLTTRLKKVAKDHNLTWKTVDASQNA